MMMIHQIEMTDMIETDLGEVHMIIEIIMIHSRNNRLIERQSSVHKCKGDNVEKVLNAILLIVKTN